jgi:o-succinylbenzoate synthase
VTPSLPALSDVLDGAGEFCLPLVTRFRGIDERCGVLLHGPAGWGEFAPFAEYGPQESSRWLAAALEAAFVGWPQPRRSVVPVNAIVPAVDAGAAVALAVSAGCATVKVKVAQPGQALADDVARVAAVRRALPEAAIRVDANGAWDVPEAVAAVEALARFDLEYVEQPCATVAACAHVRARVDVPLAIDEGVRKAADPRHVDQLREAADVVILKVPPLSGVRPALAVADAYGLPCVVSSALDSSVGLSAGAALAACLPELPYACGLGSGLLLAGDVTDQPLRPVAGQLEVRRVTATAVAPLSAAWRGRLSAAYAVLAAADHPNR